MFAYRDGIYRFYSVWDNNICWTKEMKVKDKTRDKTWVKAVVACAVLLAAACFFLALSIVYRETVPAVVCGIGVALFGTGTFLLLNPNQLACMQVVKGEMTYKQLKAAVEAKDYTVVGIE